MTSYENDILKKLRDIGDRTENVFKFSIKLLFSWSFNYRDYLSHFVVKTWYPFKERISSNTVKVLRAQLVTPKIPCYFYTFYFVEKDETNRPLSYVLSLAKRDKFIAHIAY